MKKAIIFLLFINSCFAQISNGNFEDTLFSNQLNKTFFNKWSGNYGVDITTDSKSGNFAARVWTWYNYGPGDMHYGKYVQGDYLLGGGLPINIMPTAFSGYYKFDSTNTKNKDSAFVIVALRKTNTITNKRDTIALCHLKLPPVNVYTPFTVPIVYKINGVQPDTMNIIFSSCDYLIFGASPNGTKNACRLPTMECAYLYADDLELSTPQGIYDLNGYKKESSIYPNPAGAQITLRFDSYLEGKEKISVHNAKGVEVLSFQEIHGKEITFDTDKLPTGIYFFKISVNGNVTSSGKFVICKSE